MLKLAGELDWANVDKLEKTKGWRFRTGSESNLRAFVFDTTGQLSETKTDLICTAALMVLHSLFLMQVRLR